MNALELAAWYRREILSRPAEAVARELRKKIIAGGADPFETGPAQTIAAACAVEVLKPVMRRLSGVEAPEPR